MSVNGYHARGDEEPRISDAARVSEPPAITSEDMRHLHEQFSDEVEHLQLATERVREIDERQLVLATRPRKWTEQELEWLTDERSRIELLWRVVEKERALVEELRKQIIHRLQQIESVDEDE